MVETSPQKWRGGVAAQTLNPGLVTPLTNFASVPGQIPGKKEEGFMNAKEFGFTKWY
jgi:hypothetical protein